MSDLNHDPNDAELARWLADGRAPAGSCPFCASRISMVQRNEYFTARCSHRGCGAVGPRMRDITRAADLFCCPPPRQAQGMTVHPSNLTDVVTLLEADRDTALARVAVLERELARQAPVIEAARRQQVTRTHVGDYSAHCAWKSATADTERAVTALFINALETP